MAFTAHPMSWQERLRRDRIRGLVTKAVKNGVLIRPERCPKCGRRPYGLPIQGHHEDYDEPLEVTWLCRPCHEARHREIRAAQREARRNRNWLRKLIDWIRGT